MRLIFASLILVATALPGAAQQKTYEIRQPTGPWRVPGEIQQPRGTWQTPGNVQKPGDIVHKPVEIQRPAETPIKGYGKTRPAVPNITTDGHDDPEGRQKSRRVEVVFDTCK